MAGIIPSAAQGTGTGPAAHVWDLASGQIVARLGSVAYRNVTGVAVSPDVSLALTVEDYAKVRLWQIPKGK